MEQKKIEKFKKYNAKGLDVHSMIVEELCKERGVSYNVAKKIVEIQKRRTDYQDWKEHLNNTTMTPVKQKAKRQSGLETSGTITFRVFLYAAMWFILFLFNSSPAHGIVWPLICTAVLVLLIFAADNRISRVAIIIYTIALNYVMWGHLFTSGLHL